ncbi:MAG: efflux RND transporter periplasmic adaptor subunit [Phycisphaerales bacterium]|nr:efflux RND transporter periplasmic adaptor subunit [Phycisphaerae bacterium]NNF42676.1 efflux RND transporter periplasmic adaptor subunit [Phycisphaerales bacterium]NNM26365.1 efflux RND transporter periplasmic adaptor subunit [Phycisphaerales bacterium]
MRSRGYVRFVLPLTLVGGLSLVSAQDLSAPAMGSASRQQFRGHVAPSRQVALGAAVEEVIRAITVEEGDRVDAGQVLVRLDDRLQETVTEAARLTAASDAEIRIAACELEETAENVARTRQAFDRGAATDLELRRSEFRHAKATVAHAGAIENRVLAQVKHRLEQRRLSQYRLVAPFDGTVFRLMTDVGAIVTAEDTILVLADLETLEARINVPADLYGQLEPGRSFLLAAGDPINADVIARLKNSDSIIDTASQTFRCVFTIDNRDAQLPAGFTVVLDWPQAGETPAAVTSYDQ